MFFDNLQVRQDRGRIIEENHYYAHGLKIAAISSKAYGAPNNNYLYQGDFSEMDDDLGWNDFELRSYDPQIGRFLQNDPYDQFASGYVGMGNDPVNNVDPSGGWAATGLFAGLSQAGIMGVTTLGGAIIGGAIDLISGGDGSKGLMLGAGIGLASNFASAFNWGSIGNIGSGMGSLGRSALQAIKTGAETFEQVINHSANDRENPQPTELESQYRNLVENGEYLKAINKIISAYPDEMNTDKRYYKMDFDPYLQGQFRTQEIRNGSGPTRTGYSQITFGIQDLLCINFNAIVRNVFHELWHVKQQHGIQGVDFMSSHGEREFDANYRTITNRNLPKYNPEQLKKYLQGLKNYYNSLPQNLKDKYQSQYESLFPQKAN